MNDTCRCGRCEGLSPEESAPTWANPDRVSEKCLECGFELADDDTSALCPDCTDDEAIAFLRERASALPVAYDRVITNTPSGRPRSDLPVQVVRFEVDVEVYGGGLLDRGDIGYVETRLRNAIEGIGWPGVEASVDRISPA